MIVFAYENYSITLFSQGQRGFLIILMVNQGNRRSLDKSSTDWEDKKSATITQIHRLKKNMGILAVGVGTFFKISEKAPDITVTL